jgi:integrase
MRGGYIFRRCGSCGARVPAAGGCPKCGADSFSWCYRVDVAPPGAARLRKTKGGFKTKGDALEAMARLQTEKADGTYVDHSRLTVGKYLAGWLAGGAGGHIRPTTWKTYDVAIRVHISPRIGAVALQQLDRVTVRALYQELRTSGLAKGAAPGGLAAKSVHNIHLTLRKALADALADGLIRSNPADAAHRLPSDRGEMLTWSGAELRTFLAAEADTEKGHYALWRLAAQTGMRRGELLGLRWQDFDAPAARVAIRQQLLRSGKAVTFGQPKTKAGRRSISLDPGTVQALEDVRRAQAAERLRLGGGYQDHDLVFCRADGKPHDPDSITHQFELACSRARVKRIRLHDLRHTHATLLLQANVHAKVVSERLGHSSVVVTLDRYSHVLPNMQDEAAAKAGAVLDGLG